MITLLFIQKNPALNCEPKTIKGRVENPAEGGASWGCPLSSIQRTEFEKSKNSSAKSPNEFI
jgi:hypothetical protein